MNFWWLILAVPFTILALICLAAMVISQVEGEFDFPEGSIIVFFFSGAVAGMGWIGVFST